MAIGMSNGKVDRIGHYFMQRLLKGWDIEEDRDNAYCYGAVIARRGDIKAVLDVSWAPFLRVSVLDSAEDLIPLPFLAAEQLGVLAASIAWSIARAREYRMFNEED